MKFVGVPIHNGPVSDLRVLGSALIAARIEDQMRARTPEEDRRVCALLATVFKRLSQDFRLSTQVWDWARQTHRQRIELECGHAFYKYPRQTWAVDAYRAGVTASCLRCDAMHLITRVVHIGANRRVDSLDHGDKCRACKDGIPTRHHYAPAS